MWVVVIYMCASSCDAGQVLADRRFPFSLDCALDALRVLSEMPERERLQAVMMCQPE